MGTAVAKCSVDKLEQLATKINSEHGSARGNARKTLEHMAECGRLLLEAKELVEHGEWQPWVEANTEVGYRQCVRYMRLAEGWPQTKSDSESLLGLNDALKLLAPKRATKKENDQYWATLRARLSINTTRLAD